MLTCMDASQDSRGRATDGSDARAPARGIRKHSITVPLTPAQLAALIHAVFTDMSARPSPEKNAAEGAVRMLQAEARRHAAGD